MPRQLAEQQRASRRWLSSESPQTMQRQSLIAPSPPAAAESPPRGPLVPGDRRPGAAGSGHGRGSTVNRDRLKQRPRRNGRREAPF